MLSLCVISMNIRNLGHFDVLFYDNKSKGCESVLREILSGLNGTFSRIERGFHLSQRNYEIGFAPKHDGNPKF